MSFTELPPQFARTRPSHGNIPAAYISMIGVDQRFAGRGYGGDGALTARRKALYERYGFQPLPSRPLRLFLPVATVRRMMSASGAAGGD